MVFPWVNVRQVNAEVFAIQTMKAPAPSPIRHLILVLGDQLDFESSAWDGWDAQRDVVWMAEVAEESTHVWSHQARIVLFLSAMRHFRDALRQRGITVDYTELDAPNNTGTLAGELAAAIQRHHPQRLIAVQPGDWRVATQLKETAQSNGLPLEIREDRHFICSAAEFARHVDARKSLRMEFFYREQRQRTGILMGDGKPLGGSWNFDSENRESFGKGGPGSISPPMAFPPDVTTREVIQLVRQRFSKHPGQLDSFDWPLTRADALRALDDFIDHRLPYFGTYQDALWTNEPWLYHSRLSAALNLKLLNPREVLAAAESAYRRGKVALPGVEGFVRQILGWREFVRGIYWKFMPEYIARSALGADQPLPAFYWTGDTDMNCLRHTLKQTLELGYAHHIQRLMVTGLYALLLGVQPQAVHEWYLAVYVDAVEWVELPNTLGMSQYADGGVMASKPYVASGKYIQRMSNYCTGCRFDPGQSTGPKACPFTTLYWDFLRRHRETLAGNQRMAFQLKNLDRLSVSQIAAIQAQADTLRGCSGKGLLAQAQQHLGLEVGFNGQ
jgi:deoxyribodipyrimidine photolyase-related protein